MLLPFFFSFLFFSRTSPFSGGFEGEEQNGRHGRERGAFYGPFGNQLVLILWQLDLARVKAVGFHDGEAMGLSSISQASQLPGRALSCILQSDR